MTSKETISIIDDDEAVRKSLALLMKSNCLEANSYSTSEEFIESPYMQDTSCLLLDMQLPGMNGLELYEHLKGMQLPFPTIIMTGHADINIAVQAMKKGVFDFVVKPFDIDILMGLVRKCLLESNRIKFMIRENNRTLSMIDALTIRETQVLDLLVKGNQNKMIARILEISPRTVELHRAHIMEKFEAKSISDLVRISLTAKQINSAQNNQSY